MGSVTGMGIMVSLTGVIVVFSVGRVDCLGVTGHVNRTTLLANKATMLDRLDDNFGRNLSRVVTDFDNTCRAVEGDRPDTGGSSYVPLNVGASRTHKILGDFQFKLRLVAGPMISVKGCAFAVVMLLVSHIMPGLSG